MNDTNYPQKKYRLGTVSKIFTGGGGGGRGGGGGLNRFQGANFALSSLLIHMVYLEQLLRTYKF